MRINRVWIALRSDQPLRGHVIDAVARVSSQVRISYSSGAVGCSLDIGESTCRCWRCVLFVLFAVSAVSAAETPETVRAFIAVFGHRLATALPETAPHVAPWRPFNYGPEARVNIPRMPSHRYASPRRILRATQMPARAHLTVRTVCFANRTFISSSPPPAAIRSRDGTIVKIRGDKRRASYAISGFAVNFRESSIDRNPRKADSDPNDPRGDESFSYLGHDRCLIEIAKPIDGIDRETMGNSWRV